MSISLLNENKVNTLSILSCGALEKRRILLIGNDQQLSDVCQYQLHAHGYQAKQKLQDESIRTSITKNQPFMVILDIGSSDLSSLNIITQVRSVFLGPIILLTSRNSELEQITAFNLGVDEYLVKPVSSNILNVRVDALFRRCSHQVLLDDKTEVQLGGLILYPSSYKCQIAGKPISLTQFEFKLLHLLVINVDKIMSRDFIYTNLLGREYNGSERTIDVRVSQLRDTLGKKNKAKIRIETIWGKGYMLSQVT